MTETTNKSNFRNNQSKCVFNDVGYCKYGDKCMNTHSKTICKVRLCNKKCLERHPRQCKYKLECKFLKKEICAFSHVTLATDDENLEKVNKANENKIKQLENIITNMKAEN